MSEPRRPPFVSVDLGQTDLSTALRPDDGGATVHGLDVVGSARDVWAQIGFAGQFAAVDENLAGREGRQLVGRLSRLDRRASRARTASCSSPSPR